MIDLQDKTAIVTGAGSGVGVATAATFVEVGMNVALVDIQPDSLERVRQALSQKGSKIAAFVTDVSDPQSVKDLADSVEKNFGELHVAFNNAGVAMHGTPPVEIPLKDWNWVIDVNIRGLIQCLHSFASLLRRHNDQAHVVNTASTGGLQANPCWLTGAYSMRKYAVVALSEALEQELSGMSIGVSVLCPGAVVSSLTDAASRPSRFRGPPHRPNSFSFSRPCHRECHRPTSLVGFCRRFTARSFVFPPILRHDRRLGRAIAASRRRSIITIVLNGPVTECRAA